VAGTDWRAWPWLVVTPRQAALEILEARYGHETSGPAGGRTFDLASFQEDAVVRARDILRRRGGVLIADSVGLGKTYIALALAEESVRAGERVAVAAPASLRALWRGPLRRLARANHVLRTSGLGGSDDPLTGLDSPVDSSLGWISHGRLSRGSVPTGWVEPLDLVIVDEAHGFRNARTRRYRELARMCRGARVVLLTATPVNNSLMDLYAQIRLFAGDGEFRDLGVPDLRTAFRTASLRPESPPPSLFAVLTTVLIRRTRPLLRELTEGPGIETDGSRMQLHFPRRAPPAALRYDLAAAYPGIYVEIAEQLVSLSFAPLSVSSYWAGADRGGRTERSAAGTAAAELMRLLLLKRLESSVAAFMATLRAQIRHTESFLEHLEQGRLLTPRDHRAFRPRTDDDAVQLVLGSVLLPVLPRRLNVNALAAEASADLARLRALGGQLGRVRADDPKLARLRELLGGPLASERVLLFTEFRDTAHYLWHALRDRGAVGLIHGGGAFLGRARCGRREVVERFSPLSSGAPPPPRHEEVRLLIATDVLSEGMNLQDARHVVSYDVPWNPVRLIQRVGRIDRIGSKHDTVFTHVFLPDGGLDRLLGLLARVRRKLESIRAATGAEPDAALFVDRLARGDPTLLDEIERQDAAPFEAEERLRLAYRQHRALAEQPFVTAPIVAAGIPAAVFEGAPAPGALVAVRYRGAVRLVVTQNGSVRSIDAPESFQAIAEALNAQPADACDATPDVDRLRAAGEAASRFVAGEHSDRWPGRGDRRRSIGDAVARQLLSALAQPAGGPDLTLCARAERILERVSACLPAGLERSLEPLLEGNRGRPCDPWELCHAIETVLGGWQQRTGLLRPVGGTEVDPPEVIAAIQLVATPRVTG
jgi:hypothetical protein